MRQSANTGGIGIGRDPNLCPLKWGSFDKTSLYNWHISGSLATTSKPGGQLFLSAGHNRELWAGRNSRRDTVASPSGYYPTPISPIGRIVLNPAWDEGAACPIIDSTTMQRFDYCTTADVMLGRYFSGIGFERKIATSDYEGHNGAAGHNHIRNYWGIKNVIPPEMVQSGVVGVHKSGQTSGTTTGILDLATMQQDILFCLEPWSLYKSTHVVGCQSPRKTIRLQNVVWVRTASLG